MSDGILYREFTINGATDWAHVVTMVKANAPAMAEKGTPLRVIVTEEAQDRLDDQIRYYFGVVIRTISEQVWLAGKQYTKEAWHELLAKQFLPGKEVVLPDGEIVTRRQSIARGHISLKAMTKYIRDVEAYAGSELGVRFDG